MSTSNAFVKLTFASLALVVMGCQPEPNRNDRRFGRNAFGNQAQRPNNSPGTSIVNPMGDVRMTEVAALFAAPGVSANPAWALGNVSANNGVRMWAEVYMIGNAGSGTIDKSRSRIHIEVNDSRVGQPDGVGGQLGTFVLHIGYDRDGFTGFDGGATSNVVAMRFDQAGYGSLLVTGQINGGSFSGDVSFVNTMTNNETVSLGSFSMQTCSFFMCQ